VSYAAWLSGAAVIVAWISAVSPLTTGGVTLPSATPGPGTAAATASAWSARLTTTSGLPAPAGK
jgi:hypothetical protein